MEFFGSRDGNVIQSGSPLTFFLSESSGQDFNLSSTLVYNHIPAKLMTFHEP